VINVIATTNETAFMFDGLLVLYEQLYPFPTVGPFVARFREVIPAERAAAIFLLAAKGANETYLGRFVWLLREVADPAVVDYLNRYLLDPDAEVSYTAKRLLTALGVTDSVTLPTGTDRLRLAYAAVLAQPRDFELLETMVPDRLAAITGGPQRQDVTEPLWEAWMETVHAARLSEQPATTVLANAPASTMNTPPPTVNTPHEPGTPS
jgi:hypothetical protein